MRIMPREEVEATTKHRWPKADEFMKRLAEVGERIGVTYLIENQPFNCPLGHDVIAMADHVLAVGSPRLRMCLDTGHAHITGDVVETTRAAAAAIEYLHIHDNDATQDDHRMPGDGTIDWAAFATMLHETQLNCPRMLEVFYTEAKVEEMAANGLAEKLKAGLAV
jgi:sugar phosphate isomerase/epimerase